MILILFIKVTFTESNFYYGNNALSDSTAPAVESDSSLIIARLQEGKQLYKKKCSTCHTLYKPKEFKLNVWKENLEEMKVKADLSKDEYKLIFDYLAANCKK